MISEEQRLEKLRKYSDILGVINTCDSIKEISEKTGISTSTIQRYLNDRDLYNDVLGSSMEKFPKFEDLQSWLAESKKRGLRRGGIKSQENNGYSKDASGKFTGGRKK